MSFDRLGLSPELLRAVAQQGYTEPTPVQREAIPLVLAGRDLLAGAQTGTGKTAAFVLPILQRLHKRTRRANGAPRPIRVLVLAPTRELALQVEESVRTYGAQRPIRSTAIYGGVGFDPQVRAPARRARDRRRHAGPPARPRRPAHDRPVAGRDPRPRRGRPHARHGLHPRHPPDPRAAARRSARTCSSRPRSRTRSGASPAASCTTRRTVQVTPAQHRRRARRAGRHPGRPRAASASCSATSSKSGRVDQALVFTRTKHGAEPPRRAARRATASPPRPSTATRASRSACARSTDFKAGRVAILVATDVAARGLDIEPLPHVVNYELPMVAEDYVHRIGRTGRAGVDGDAISLVCVDERPLLRDIERLLGAPIPSEVIPGFEPDPRIRPEPIRRSGQGGARPGAGPRQRPIGAPRYGAGAPRHDAVGRPGGHAPRPHRRQHGLSARDRRPSRRALAANRGGVGGGHGPAGNRGGHAPARRLEGGRPSGGRPAQPGQWLGQRPNQGGRPVQGGPGDHGPRPIHGPRSNMVRAPTTVRARTGVPTVPRRRCPASDWPGRRTPARLT